jgi:hypothetical protein
MLHPHRAALIAIFILARMTFASAGQIILQEGLNSYAGTRDTTLYSNFPNNSSGGETGLLFGTTNQLTPQLNFIIRRGLLRFDVSAIPPGSTIQSVTLAITVDLGSPGSGSKPLTIHRLLADWGEGTNYAGGNGGNGGLPAQAGDATWNSNHHGASAWTTAGGDSATSPSAALSIGTTGDLQYLVSDPDLTADVQAWVNDPSMNFGWLFIGKEDSTSTARRLYSREDATLNFRPKLTIDYIEPVNAASGWRALD